MIIRNLSATPNRSGDFVQNVRHPHKFTLENFLVATRFASVLMIVLACAFAGCDASVQTEEDAPILQKKVAEEFNPAETESQIDHSLKSAETQNISVNSENEVLSSPVGSGEAEGSKNTRDDWHALLVGCTTYDHLDSESSLKGPKNDVVLMRKLLIDRYQFSPDQITTLTEGQDLKHRPTKQNIQRELERLVSESAEGDSVMILLSGHGSQQPDNDPENPGDPEPDGLDEVFLPADVSEPEDPEAIEIVNGLCDDELRGTLSRLRSKGAFVWFISDSCHSGSSIRGTERYRQIPPDRFFKRDLLQAARARGVGKRNLHDSSEMDSKLERDGGYVAIYAAQPNEPTIELQLPPGEESGDWRGLLSYTMVKVLLESDDTLTYRELVQRIHAEYVQSMGRLGPTPLIEGSAQDRTVLGGEVKKSTSRLVLLKDELDQWKISAGQLEGLSRGSIFEVHPPPGSGHSDSVLGHVRITVAQISDSLVEPVEYNKLPLNESLPVGGVCRLVLMKHNRFSLKVAIQNSGKSDEFAKSISRAIETYQEQTNASIKLVEDPENADWIVRIHGEDPPMLMPAAGWSEQPDERRTAFSPALENDKFIDWLCPTLGKISRASGLLKVSGSQPPKRNRKEFGIDLLEECEVEVQLVRLNDDAEPEILKWGSSGLQLEEGDLIALNVTNTGLYEIDFSVLFVDSQYGIDVLFPEPGVVADNRIEPGDEFTIGPMKVDATTAGLEHLIVIASLAEGQPLDWSWLAQPSLGATATRSASSHRSLQSPTGEWLKNAMFTADANRGIQFVKPDTIRMAVISWTTQSDSKN